MVFTDIKNSTLLWETFPVAMRSGIKIHNMIMRRQLRNVGGYEVKTEGDAFMVCFPTATSALRWCFTVQKYLLDQEWPNEILECDNGREILDTQGNMIYRGLSVRIGIHWGSPVCEPDPITGRMDYFGPMVNRAARISAVADGGQTAVSSDVLVEINRCVKAYTDVNNKVASIEEAFGDLESGKVIMEELRLLIREGFEVKELGQRKLKGLENPEFIYLMYPTSLAGRMTAKSSQVAAPVARPAVDPHEIWSLWNISLKLEMLCSSLNVEADGSDPMRRPHNVDMAARLKDAPTDGTADLLLIPLLEHIITRIENCIAVLYLRRLLAPPPDASSNLPVGAAGGLMDLIGMLEGRLGTSFARPPEVTAPPSIAGSIIGGGSSSIDPKTPINELQDPMNQIVRRASSTPGVSPTTTTPRQMSMVTMHQQQGQRDRVRQTPVQDHEEAGMARITDVTDLDIDVEEEGERVFEEVRAVKEALQE